MTIQLITPPDEDAITLAEAKEYLRIDTDDEDADIRRMLNAATTEAQRTTDRPFVTATYQLGLNGFPYNGCSAFPGRIEFPNAPLQSITSIKYTDTDGNEQTVDAADYIVNTAGQPGFVDPAFGTAWPTAQLIADSVRIVFVCGYGDDGSYLPEDLSYAIKLMTSHFYENREIVSTDSMTEVPYTWKSIMAQYSIPEFY